MGTRVWPRFPDPPVSSTFITFSPVYRSSPGNTRVGKTVCPHRIEDVAHLRPDRTRERNGLPQPAPESHVFRAGPAPGAQHHHRVDVRGWPPLQLHDARRLRPNSTAAR